MGIGWTFAQSAAAEWGLWVATNGKRFVNELANRKVRADAIMVEQSEGRRAVAICNPGEHRRVPESAPRHDGEAPRAEDHQAVPDAR